MSILEKDPETKVFRAYEAKYEDIAKDFNEIIAWRKRIEGSVITRADFIAANIMDKVEELSEEKIKFQKAWTELTQTFINQPPYNDGPEDFKRFHKNDDVLCAVREGAPPNLSVGK